MKKGNDGSTGALVCGCLLLAVSACGTETQPAPDLCGVVSAIAEADCAQMERCISTEYAAQTGGSVACVDYISTLYDVGLAEVWRTGIQRGRIVYHPERLDACRTALTNVPCAASVDSPLPSACWSMFEGTMALGERCASYVECEAGLTCAHSRCAEPRPPSHACQLDCPDGATCEPEFTFLPYCMVHGETDACGGTTVCSGYRICVGATSTSEGHCVSLSSLHSLEVGEACPEPGSAGYTAWCRDGLQCAETARDASGASVWACEATYESGGSCHYAAPDGCPTGEYCQLTGDNLDGRCAPLPTLGEACAREFSERAIVCAAGLSCEWTSDESRTCVPSLPGGAPCNSLRECASGVCLDNDGGYGRQCASLACQ